MRNDWNHLCGQSSCVKLHNLLIHLLPQEGVLVPQFFLKSLTLASVTPLYLFIIASLTMKFLREFAVSCLDIVLYFVPSWQICSSVSLCMCLSFQQTTQPVEQTSENTQLLYSCWLSWPQSCSHSCEPKTCFLFVTIIVISASLPCKFGSGFSLQATKMPKILIFIDYIIYWLLKNALNLQSQ